MWTRKELKARGKVAFKANYWRSVFIAFLATLLVGTASSTASGEYAQSAATGESAEFENAITDALNGVDPAVALAGLAVMAVILLAVIVVAVVIDIFVLNPLSVGCNNFFLENRRNHDTGIGAIEHGFKHNYKNCVAAMFKTKLFIALWGLLFIIPGIIKSYQYYLVEYILSDDPSISSKDAMLKSKELMHGNKWKTFILELSFILWDMLSGITFGLVGLFYVNPYKEATKAELYIALAHPEEI